MPTRLYLVRHGEVAEHWRGRIYGRLDVELSARGEEEARRVAERIPLDPSARPVLVVSSPLERARFGATRIAERLELEPRVDTDLLEINRGAWAGETVGEIESLAPGELAAWYRNPATRRPPGGESLEDMEVRVLPALERWAGEGAGGSVAIVAHLWVLRLAACSALGLDLDRAGRLDVPTGELLVLDWPSNREESETLRPTLAGLGVSESPRGRGWFRGPHRSAR